MLFSLFVFILIVDCFFISCENIFLNLLSIICLITFTKTLFLCFQHTNNNIVHSEKLAKSFISQFNPPPLLTLSCNFCLTKPKRCKCLSVIVRFVLLGICLNQTIHNPKSTKPRRHNYNSTLWVISCMYLYVQFINWWLRFHYKYVSHWINSTICQSRIRTSMFVCVHNIFVSIFYWCTITMQTDNC